MSCGLKEAVVAVVSGQPLQAMPADLFIPPDALEVLLESFTGPLDLLLYLIRQQNIDILDIPMTHITEQYLAYIDLLEATRLELAADYLVMAALLIEIKSKMLLPIISSAEEAPEADPRLELVKRLQVYEQFKTAALQLDELPRLERDVFEGHIPTTLEAGITHPEVSLAGLVAALEGLLKEKNQFINHQITREVLSVQEKMSAILLFLQETPFVSFEKILTPHEGRLGIVVNFLAILELAKQALVSITQTTFFAPIYLKANEYDKIYS